MKRATSSLRHQIPWYQEALIPEIPITGLLKVGELEHSFRQGILANDAILSHSDVTLSDKPLEEDSPLKDMVDHLNKFHLDDESDEIEAESVPVHPIHHHHHGSYGHHV